MLLLNDTNNYINVIEIALRRYLGTSNNQHPPTRLIWPTQPRRTLANLLTSQLYCPYPLSSAFIAPSVAVS